MSRFTCFAIAAAVLALSATAASAQIFPLTNGPNDTGSNVVDSAKGFDGINAVAPEREFLVHPERAGNATAGTGAVLAAPGGIATDSVTLIRRHARHRHRHAYLR